MMCGQYYLVIVSNTFKKVNYSVCKYVRHVIAIVVKQNSGEINLNTNWRS